jgi:DNA-binding NarL/FixJ family response regulator
VSVGTAQSELTVLIADDDPAFRGFIRGLVETEPETRVIGEARDGDEAVRLARELRPRVVLMDIAMPRANGLEALRSTKAAMPETKVIVVTVHGEDVYRRVAIAGGADAFVLKKALATDLLPAIRRIAAGRDRSA